MDTVRVGLGKQPHAESPSVLVKMMASFPSRIEPDLKPYNPMDGWSLFSLLHETEAESKAERGWKWGAPASLQAQVHITTLNFCKGSLAPVQQGRLGMAAALVKKPNPASPILPSPLKNHINGQEELLTRRISSALSWFNPSQQLSTTQPLTHSPHPVGRGKRIEKKKKKQKLVG